MKSFEKPVPVAGVKAFHRDGKIVISWSYPRESKIAVKGFYVERAEGSAPFENIAFLKADVSQYTDERFEINREYRYKIRVYSIRNVISDDSPELKVIPARLPDPPKGLAYRLTNDSVEIAWDKVADGITYNIYRSAEKGKYSPVPLNAKPLDKPFFRDAIDVEKPVYYEVRSVVESTILNEGGPSAYLEVTPQSFVPVSPADVRYVRAQSKVYLSWKENPETWVRGYKVYRKKSSGQFEPVGETPVPLFVDEEPAGVKTSYYVTALGPVKESAPSEMMTVNP